MATINTLGREHDYWPSFERENVQLVTEGIERMKWTLDPNSPNELYIGDRKLVRDWT